MASNLFKSGHILTRRRLITGATAVGAAAVLPFDITSANADTYPSRNFDWIIYQSPGGLIDATTRTIQPYLKANGFGSQIEYVRGASGRIARTKLFRAPPDGYMVMTEASPEEVLGEVVYNAEYKVSEFSPVFGWTEVPLNIFVKKDSPIKTFADYVKMAKSRTVTIGTFGKGGPSHLQLAIVRKKLGLNLQFVHFEGGAPAHIAVLGGHIDSAMAASTASRWLDTIDVLTVFSETRDPALPNVPTSGEAGYEVTVVKEYIYANAGPGVPADSIKKLAAAFAKAFEDPNLVEQQKKLGVYYKAIPGTELRKIINNMYGLVNEHKAELLE